MNSKIDSICFLSLDLLSVMQADLFIFTIISFKRPILQFFFFVILHLKNAI